MSVTKLAFVAATIAGAAGASARADAILTLGIFSSASTPGAVGSTGSASAFNLASTDATSQVAPVNPPVTLFTPAPSSTTATSAPASIPLYDAYLNFGTGSFLDANNLTTGNPQAWYSSPKITGLFGGQPTAQQIASFDATVLQRAQQTFQLGGIPVTLTDNPNQAAAHMLSVVSHTVNPSMTNVIGMTNIGENGFHFIDNSAPYASTVDQLEWIVAHNVAHELMLAFGVPEIHDQTGHYIDSTIGQMSMFLNPASTFSPAAVQDLLSKNFLQVGGSFLSYQAQLLDPVPAPEPATFLVWGAGTIVLLAGVKARSRRAST